MNFLVCETPWTVSSGSFACDSTAHTYTVEQMRDQLNPGALTQEETQLMLDSTMILLATVFGFLALRKML